MATTWVRDENGIMVKSNDGKQLVLTPPQFAHLQEMVSPGSAHLAKQDTRVINQLIKKGLLAHTQGANPGEVVLVVTAAGKRTIAGEAKPTHTRRPSITPLGSVEVKKGPAKKALREAAVCMCGCGGATKSSFVSGHDAKYKAFLKTIGVMFDRAQGSVAAFAMKHGYIR